MSRAAVTLIAGATSIALVVVGAITDSATGSTAGSATRSTAAVTPAVARVSLTATTRHHRKPTNHLLFGLTIPDLPTGNPASMQALRQREKQLHHAATIVSYFQSWSSPFDPLAATNVWRAGALPMLSWDPYNPRRLPPAGTGSAYEKNWTLPQVLSGRYDSYIRTTARQMAALDFPIALRIAHEQNGNWNPWGIHVVGPDGGRVNTAAAFRQMWRHVWRIFHAEHADNVIFVWSPNAPNHLHRTLGATYPGSKYVDWAAVSAYMYTSTSWGYIGRALRALRAAAPGKPEFIAETGVGSSTTDRALGIAHLLHHVLRVPLLNGWVYLDSASGRSDWRFETNAKELKTLRRGLQNKHYFTALPTTQPH